MKDTLSELWNYRGNICKPNIKRQIYGPFVFSDKTKETLRCGTYIKPVARLVGKIARRFGYTIRYRGRGLRSPKYHNFNNDIRVSSALFLAVYADKTY